MTNIDKWTIRTIEDAAKEHEETKIKFGDNPGFLDRIYGWVDGKTFCCLCDSDNTRVASGEIYVDAEQYHYTVQICPECIEKLYNLVKKE